MRKVWILMVAACAPVAPRRPMQLSRVVLYQNGIGYFERHGHVAGDTLKLTLARSELDDVLKTLTVIDRLGAAVATVDVPSVPDAAKSIALGVRMSAGRVHDLQVSYAVPTPTWKAAYRVVLDPKGGLLQGWAMVNNVSQEDWNGVSLTLATGAPMSFAMDLHTPEYVKRPDATGRLVAPTVLGPVDGEVANAVDRDGDGILDVEDRCPNEPESYNGFDDDDGCPDRGRVVVTDTSIEILDRVLFAKNSDALRPESASVIDATAATLRGNPEIAKLEIQGHASSDEADPWGLAARRAAAVRAALIARGVDGERLTTMPYGATTPLDAKAAEKNRRIEFLITQRRQVEDVPQTSVMRRSVHTASKPADVAGSVRYVLSEPVSIKRGASTMVSILNSAIAAEDAFLYRPDGNAPGSERHPFRAVRLVNDSGFTLEPGPIAIFARGTFVGDSLIARLDAGQTAWVPYALDGATSVTPSTQNQERPVKIVSIARGVLTVENAAIRTTHYAIAPGREPAKRLYIHHAKAPGYAARDLPPGAIDQGDAYLIPIPLAPGRPAELVVEEREPRTRTIELLDGGSTQLGLYVEGTKLPPGVATQLAAAIALRTELGKLEEDLEAARGRLGDVAARAEQLRENLKSLEKVRGADDLKKKLVASLAAATADADALARTIGSKSEALAVARRQLQDQLAGINL